MSRHSRSPRHASDSDVQRSPIKDLSEGPTFRSERALPSFDDLEHNIVKIAMLGEACVGKSGKCDFNYTPKSTRINHGDLNWRTKVTIEDAMMLTD